MHRCMLGRNDGCSDGWVEAWMDSVMGAGLWMYAQMDGWIDG